MRAQVREIAVLAAAVLLGACTSTSASIPSSVTASTSTTTTSSTTTIPATTISTTTLTSTTTTVVEVDGVPAELLALIGAPMPDVDLTIKSEEDVERWLEEFFRFGYWLSANPTTDEQIVSVGYVRGTTYFDDVVRGKENLIAAGVVGLGGELEVISIKAHYADAPLGMFRIEIGSRRAESLFTWNVEEWKLVHVLDPDPTTEVVRSDLFVQQREDGTWGLLSWQH